MIKKLILILLALCAVFFMIGCDGGGGGGGGNNSPFDTEYEEIKSGTGKTYVVYDIFERTDPPISEFSRVSDGIRFKEDSGMGILSVEINITIFLNDDKKFASKEGGKINGESMGSFEYTGTWEQSGTTITMTATKEKDLETGTIKDVNIVVKTDVSPDGSTMTDQEIHGEAGGRYIYKKQ